VVHIVLGRAGLSVTATPLTDQGEQAGDTSTFPLEAWPAFAQTHEAARVRWVWSDTAEWYPAVLAAGHRVARCHDLRLSRRILRGAASVTGSAAGLELQALPPDSLDRAAAAAAREDRTALFDLTETGASGADVDPIVEIRRQLAAVAGSANAGALRLLLAAESAGALAAAEMRFAGVPWRADVHERILAEALGPRVPLGARPRSLEHLAATLRTILDDPELNPDSPADLLRSLRRAGLTVESTNKWELRRVEHPVVEPLLEYKRLYRLLTANGWAWVDEWIRDGRFRPEYVVGGVVTGRWATNGGGALQLPKQVRSAVVADPGWKLVVADAAQLEPRVLAALSGDLAMAEAGRGKDLYDGVVSTGAVADRPQAKTAMLGAMYGATQGQGGLLVPRLQRAFPRAIGLVEQAARAGERGEQVATRLGRTSPAPGREWLDEQAHAYSVDGTAAQERAARSRARSWGRFTRNFIVQGTAAEWALSWMAGVRTRFAERFPGPLTDGPHLAYFLHDELMVHTPAEHAEWAAEQVRAAGNDAGHLLFGSFPVDFPLSVAIVDDYGSAK
jgi:DNA polymerase-1